MTEHLRILKHFRQNLSWRAWGRRGLVLLRNEAENAHKVALGAAIGVAISFLPLPGLAGIVSLLVAWLLGGSLMAAFLAQLIGNPWTFAPIFLSSFAVGEWLLNVNLPEDGLEAMAAFSWQALTTNFWGTLGGVMGPMFVGGAALGGALGLITYALVRWQVQAFWRRHAAKKSAQNAQRKLNRAARAQGLARRG